jgi:hypothetical protein
LVVIISARPVTVPPPHTCHMQVMLSPDTIDEPVDAAATFKYMTREKIPAGFTGLFCATVPAGCNVAAGKLGGLLFDTRVHRPTITSPTLSAGSGATHVEPTAVPLVQEVYVLK